MSPALRLAARRTHRPPSPGISDSPAPDLSRANPAGVGRDWASAECAASIYYLHGSGSKCRKNSNPFYLLGLQRYFPLFQLHDGIALGRTDLISNREWDRSFDLQVIHHTIGVDHVLWCFRSIPDAADEQIGMIALRQNGRKDFQARDKAILAEAHAQVAMLVGGTLARFGEPSPTELPPRIRQILRCLLGG